MQDLTQVLNLTKKTFDVYVKAKNLFEEKNYQNSFELFGQVIFNLYSIKKNLNNNISDSDIKDSIYQKVEDALKKSSEYIKELEIINNLIDSEEEDSSLLKINKKKLLNEILLYTFEGDIIKVQELIENNNLELNIKNSIGETPLHIAVKNGDTRMTEMLLKNGSDINAVTDYGLTVMEISCVNKDFKMISLLQDYGCKLDKLINLRDNNNNSPGKLKSNKIDLIITIKNLLKKIQPLKISKTDSFFQIKEKIINSNFSKKKKIIILNVLDFIEKSNSKIGWNDIQQDDILQIVWNAIHSEFYLESKDEIIKCLFEELYYSKNINKHNIYCPSTIYERIIYCLAGFNPEVVNINLNCVIDYEMILYASNLKKKILEEKNDEFKNTYNSAIFTEEQETLIDNFNIKFKEILINNLIDCYVKTNIMKKKELIMLLNKWIDSI